jgi:hypothetical protein
MDICPCLKHTYGLIFSSLVVKRSFIGVYMKSSITRLWKSAVELVAARNREGKFKSDPAGNAEMPKGCGA